MSASRLQNSLPNLLKNCQCNYLAIFVVMKGNAFYVHRLICIDLVPLYIFAENFFLSFDGGCAL